MAKGFTRRIAYWPRVWRESLRGVDLTVRPLPAPTTDLPVNVADLVEEAQRHGTRDGQALAFDHWSFATEGGDEYIRSLRRRCEAAVRELRERNTITAERVSHVDSRRREAENHMVDARTRMARIASYEASIDYPHHYQHSAPAPAPAPAAAAAPAAMATSGPRPQENPEDTVWEGETRVLSWLWQVLILGVLAGLEYIIQNKIYVHCIGGGFAIPMTLLTTLLTVIAPYLAGMVYRARHSVAGERHLTVAILMILAVPWLIVIGTLGVLRGRLLHLTSLSDADSAKGFQELHITPLTTIIVFVALMLMVGLMALMLGLARRHPIQEAYVRHRQRRDVYGSLCREMIDTLNPSYRTLGDDSGCADPLGNAEQIIRESYGAAEEAYYAALITAVGDPTFTESVQNRRDRRPSPTPVA